ncbi:MAG TPA: alpha/beta fold hydrolase [Marmoricola sp.]|nr:alpha/beta fold hydrolase [Marmoricola sp.]
MTFTGYTHDGLRFDVRDQGPAHGEPVVLLHGFPQRASSWDGVAARLHDAGFRTIAPDQRGYSPGARPRGRRAYAVSHLVGDVVALVDALGAGPVHLVGHDWGAAVAWAVAGQHADRVRTLTTVSVPHPRAFIASMRRGQALRSWYFLPFNVPGLVEAVAGRRPDVFARLLRNAGMTQEMVAEVRSGIVEYGALPGALAWYRALPVSGVDGAGPVRVPTTHVWSTGDVALARVGAELTERWVAAPYRLEVLEGVSHWIPEQAPEALAGIIAQRARSAG